MTGHINLSRLTACPEFTHGENLMKTTPPRPSITLTLGTLVILLLISCFGALTEGVVRARETMPSGLDATETATSANALMQSSMTGCSAPSFSAPSYFGIGGGTIPAALATGDFNLDGKPDVVTANQTSHNVSILLGDGTGNYPTATTVAVGSINPSGVSVADFNLDGKPDLAVTTIASANVTILLGNGMGGFGAPTAFGTGASAQQVVIADFNRDGKPDMAVAIPFSNAAGLFLGNGSGGFGARTDFSMGANPFTITTADFNRDGNPDIATGNFTSNDVSVRFGDGIGGFGAAANFSVPAGSNPQSIIAADFNLDGKPDLVTTNGSTASVSVLLNNGSGGFGAATNFAVGASPREMAAGDLNHDGKPDLAVTNSGASSVSILLGDGMGGFGAATNFPVDNSVRAIAAADLNLDGRLDLVMRSALNPSPQNIAVMLNTCAAQCANFAFTEAMGSPYPTGSGMAADPIFAATADFNLDGKPDVAAANFGDNNVAMFLGNGMGGFMTAGGSPFAAGSTPNGGTTGDFNLDGRPDLAIANGIFPGTLTILLGDGLGGLAPASGSPISLGLTSTSSIATGDFNLDGRPDLATANRDTDNVTILLGNGMGGFAPAAGSPFGAGDRPQYVAAGDFNLDGKADLATANSNSNDVTVLLGDGMGGFAPAGSPIATGGTSPTLVSVADFNLDGKPDLAVGNSFSHNITILLGDGLGGFAPTAQSPISGTFAPRALTVSDFNLDGKPDLAVAISITTQLVILRGDGSGSFTSNLLTAPGAPFSIPVADYNLDGKPDLATTNLEDDNLRVLLNTCEPGAPPSITSTPITIQQTASLTSTQIATVSDEEDAEASLVVTVNSGLSATVNGVTVSNISVDSLGVVRADVSAACGSSNASFTLTVTDTGGASASATLDVTVTTETTPPTISCPSNITQSTDPDQCSAVVNFTTPTANDNCPGATVMCNPATGSTFQKGITTVNCTATDAAGNTAQCSFTVTVNDAQSPTITCPSNITQSTDEGGCSTVVNFATPESTDNCPGVGTVTCSPASGSTFPKGTTTVTCSATDAAGNNGSCSFTVTVNDTEPPSITCPSNVVTTTDLGQCASVVTYSDPAVSDNCSGVGSPVCNPPSGSTFPQGVTTVNCTVSDSAGNSSNCQFTVTVNDTEPPSITCPSDILFTTPGPSDSCGVVNYVTSKPSDNCSAESVVCSPASGFCFPLGMTTVTCTVTDLAGNTAQCSFKITVQNPCTITCPANIVRNNDAGQCGAVATFAPTTTGGGCGTVSCSPASGSFFPKGTTTVSCTTTAGPACSFTVTVNDTQLPMITCPPNQTRVALRPSDTTVVVSYPAPLLTDNCPGASVVCSPPSGSIFPLGTTTVSCLATDSSGNQAGCSFTVTTFDICLQDDGNAATVILFNSFTGDYLFCCDGTTWTGTGTMQKQGNTYTLTHNTSTRRVLTRFDGAQNKGTASLQSPPGTNRCTINDRDTRNNSCLCAASTPQ